MLGVIFRLFWRLLVLFLVIGLAYGSFFIALPYLDKRLPIFPAILILYIGLAYFAIPALTRFWRIVFKPNHIPVYVTTRDGWASDPVNIAVVTKSKKHLIHIMERAGWHTADKSTLRNLAHEAYAITFNKPYPRAPFSALYLFGRKQDIGFQIQDGDPPTPRHRHHVRFWQLTDAERPRLHKDYGHHHSFWQTLFVRFFRRKKQVWVGAATHDISPFALRMRNFQVTHLIDEDTDKEREFLIDTLRNSNQLRDIDIVDSGNELRFRGQTFGVNIVVDSFIKVLELKSPYIPAAPEEAERVRKRKKKKS